MREKITNAFGQDSTESKRQIAKVSILSLIIVFSLVVPFVGGPIQSVNAQTTTIIDDFESGDYPSGWTGSAGLGTADFTRTNTHPIEGDWSLYHEYSDTEQQLIETSMPNNPDNIVWSWNFTEYNNPDFLFDGAAGANSNGDSGDRIDVIYVENGQLASRSHGTGLVQIERGEVYTIRMDDIDYTAKTYTLEVYDESGAMIYSENIASQGGFTGDINTFAIYAFGHTFKTDYIAVNTDTTTPPDPSQISGTVTDDNSNAIDNATVELTSNNTIIDSATTDSNGSYAVEGENGDYNITASKQGYYSQKKTVTISGSDQTIDFVLEKIPSNLEIIGPNFVRPTESIPYSVRYTNDTGRYTVTEYANVTSANVTILSVNEANNTLQAGSENATVEITAGYNSTEGPVNVTEQYYVSYLKLSNIDTVPPSKWIQAFLGFDDGYAEGQNMKGIGSEIQWLLFMIIVMSVIGKTFDNPWAGIGSGVITGVLLWVLEYISLGLLLSTVFFGIFIGLILVRVRRDGGNEVTINES